MLLTCEPKDGDAINMTKSMYPVMIHCRTQGGGYHASPSSTTYAVCYEGDLTLTSRTVGDPDLCMKAGTVATFTGGRDILPKGAFTLFLIERLGYRGMVGLTQIEDRGRLTYIDGCSDSLIFGPHRMGDGCLNSLFFPPNINQSFHTHPDIRAGIVLSGKGVACLQDQETPLKAGSMFVLEEGEIHRFRTEAIGMKIVAYHPTSDTGPTDESHPMKTRTHIYDKS